MSEEVIGQEAKLYRNTATNASPAWNEIDRIRDLSAPATKGQADTSRRASKFKYQKPALVDIGLTFTYVYKKGATAVDADFDALLDSFVNGTEIQFAVMDQAIGTTGAKGWRFFGSVVDFSADQNLESEVLYSVEIKPTATEESSALVEPSFYEVS